MKEVKYIYSLQLILQENGIVDWVRSNNNFHIASYSPYYNLLLASSGGNVGIGTTSPETLLTVGSHAFTNGTRDLIRLPSYRHNEAFTIRNNDDGVTGRLEFYWGNSQNGSGGHDNTIDKSILTMVHDGKVGIGTTSPEYLLQLGSLGASNNVYSETKHNSAFQVIRTIIIGLFANRDPDNNTACLDLHYVLYIITEPTSNDF